MQIRKTGQENVLARAKRLSYLVLCANSEYAKNEEVKNKSLYYLNWILLFKTLQIARPTYRSLAVGLSHRTILYRSSKVYNIELTLV